MSHGIARLLRIERNTADLDRAVAFYRDALGFQVDGASTAAPEWTRLPGVCDAPTRCARLSLGGQAIEFAEFPGTAPYPADGTVCDLWFQHFAIVVNDMPAAYARVMRHATAPITRDGPRTLPPSTGSVTCFKFRDPDGHPLELIQFPAGSGDPHWQSIAVHGPALGIDHTAISVGDVGRSTEFYELLGLRVTARGVNRGTEQHLLDGLEDVEVDVVALQAVERTPHLELLGYRRPRGRATAAIDLTAVVADRMVWRAEAIDVLVDALDDAGFNNTVIASGVIDDATVALLRDPDGHLLVLRESTAHESA